MNSANERPTNVRPLLTTMATLRSGDDHLPGYYDPVERVWMIDSDEGPCPIIEAQPELSELVTKTEEVRERDDESIAGLLALSTKTSHIMERDDESLGVKAFLNTITVTKAPGERTDFDLTCYK